MLDEILHIYFTILGGTSFVLGIMGVFLAFTIILSLVDNIIDL